MTEKHAEKLNEELDKLTTEEKLKFYEESRGESLADAWRDFGDEEFKNQLEFIQSFKKSKQ